MLRLLQGILHYRRMDTACNPGILDQHRGDWSKARAAGVARNRNSHAISQSTPRHSLGVFHSSLRIRFVWRLYELTAHEFSFLCKHIATFRPKTTIFRSNHGNTRTYLSVLSHEHILLLLNDLPACLIPLHQRPVVCVAPLMAISTRKVDGVAFSR